MLQYSNSNYILRSENILQLIHLLVAKSHTSSHKTHAFKGQCVSCERTKANTGVLIIN